MVGLRAHRDFSWERVRPGVPPALLALMLPRVHRPAPRARAAAPALNVDVHLRLQLLRVARAPPSASAALARRGLVLGRGRAGGEEGGELVETGALGGGEGGVDEAGVGERAELCGLVDKRGLLSLHVSRMAYYDEESQM